jgi:hypothetical protein
LICRSLVPVGLAVVMLVTPGGAQTSRESDLAEIRERVTALENQLADIGERKTGLVGELVEADYELQLQTEQRGSSSRRPSMRPQFSSSAWRRSGAPSHAESAASTARGAAAPCRS